ncbi:MAG: trypsin-like serine protease [Bacteroidota bacterium]|nr:trypsin-like serine protease [Bacteroidota bacterium]
MKNITLTIFLLLVTPLFLFSQADIVGGDDANISDYPYQAALGYQSSQNSFFSAYCGASIINEYWALTAAHCVQGENANTTSIRVGATNSYASGGDIYQAAEIIAHNGYNGNSMNNDIALIRLENPIQFNNNVQPVLLICDQQVQLGAEDVGQTSWITGWGEDEGTANNPNQLQVVDVPITATSNYGGNQIDADMIMAGFSNGGYDSCQGDSGGPMVVLASDEQTYLQVGIVSWGYGCAEAGYPGVYARVSYFIDWICSNTNGDVCANEQEFCNANAVFGCTDPIAENYNLDATLDDGSCEYILGCTDNTANNFSPIATQDDGSCQYSCDNTVSLYLVIDCYGEEISWDLVNENGNIIAQVSEGTYPGGSTTDTMEEGGSTQQQEICLSAGCYTFTITDSYGDGVGGSEFSCGLDGTPFSITDQNGEILFEENDPIFGDCESGENNGPCSATYSFCVSAGEPVYGCTDPLASNYNSEANTNDGSCIYDGCTDSNACNYNSFATNDDGSCEYSSCAGCTDENFLEYDSSALIDDGSCITLIVSGCTDPIALNFNESANSDDGTCEYQQGCTDPNADNYDPNAIQDDGSCIYPWEPCDILQWSENFESYNSSNIDPQSTDWVGWDNINSGVDVTENFGFGSNQSILVEQNDDVVHIFDGINAGSGEVIFWMYIPSSGGAGAYYNILHGYNTPNAGQNSIWAHQIMFASAESGEQSVLDAAGYAAVSFDAIYDTWVEVRQEIDLDNDYTTLYYNGQELYSWQFSQDAGGEQQLNVLDAINFFGTCGGAGCTAMAYFDNIEMCGDFKVEVFGCTDPSAVNYNPNATVDDGSCIYDTSDIEENNILEMNLFPNPNNGSFSITLNDNLSSFNLSIINILGQEVYTQQVKNYSINSKQNIKVDLVKGTYIVNLKTEGNSIKIPVIIE